MITRFAPSPTGPLHLGHAYSAILAHDMAKAQGGTFLLRIEDIDRQRSKSHWEAQIYDDLRWLGLSWPEPVMRQSDRQPTYDSALDSLWSQGLLYPCTCTRRDIFDAVSAPQEGAPETGPDGIIYPGTCRSHAPAPHSDPGERPNGTTLRLHMPRALERLDAPMGTDPLATFEETGERPGQVPVFAASLINSVGDPVLARRDMATSYHLSVVVDDAAQAITDVVRGQDLFEATQIHVLLQSLLGLPTPRYHHHRLIRDDAGRRLAKRDDARAIARYRADGLTPTEIRTLVRL